MSKHLPARKTVPSQLPLPRMPKQEELLDPLQLLITRPQSAWPVLRQNEQTLKSLFEAPVLLLAAIPSVSGFVGNVLFGPVGFISGIGNCVAVYLLCLFFFLVATLLAQHSAQFFQGAISRDEAAKLVVYSVMPFFLCSIFLAIPPLKVGFIFGAYSLYLFYLGAKEMAAIPKGKQFTYCALNIVAWIFYVDLFSSALFR